MTNNTFLFIAFTILTACTGNHRNHNMIQISRNVLFDKIKGGWAGQVIGCTYGGPTEFKFNGTMIQDYTPIPWNDSLMLWWYINEPGLYDDVYMDLTFVNVFNRCGLDAPVDSFANQYANAEYLLWHANQAGRYNILNGIRPPESGHWKNNPHADCIDFQIEADFAGLMSPGMVNTSSSICNKIGHIMNYGDGWYGGVYVAAMYSLAFVSKDISFIVTEALKTIPEETKFHSVINDVIHWYKKYPADWRATWFELQKKWSEDISCPDGIYKPFNIDATVNCAYVVIGLLYGKGDYGRTLDITTRCGQDSDCNPATAGGILGVMLGYSNIPNYWKDGLNKVEDLDFKYTTVSLHEIYQMSMNHALENIIKHKGKITDSLITICYQNPVSVGFEQSFPGIFPCEKISLPGIDSSYQMKFRFTGSGIVIPYNSWNWSENKNNRSTYVAAVKIVIDETITDTVYLPDNRITRKTEVYWNYKLLQKEHTVSIRWLNPATEKKLIIKEAIIFSNTPKSFKKY